MQRRARLSFREAPGHPVRRPVEVIGHLPQFHETETNDDFGQPVGDLLEVGIDPLRIARRPGGGCAPGVGITRGRIVTLKDARNAEKKSDDETAPVVCQAPAQRGADHRLRLERVAENMNRSAR